MHPLIRRPLSRYLHHTWESVYDAVWGMDPLICTSEEYPRVETYTFNDRPCFPLSLSPKSYVALPVAVHSSLDNSKLFRGVITPLIAHLSWEY